jgi:hypothetical protein
MKVDVEELVFDDCVVGATYVKDFTVWNLSEIALSLSINHVESGRTRTLAFSVYDTAEPGLSHFIAPFVFVF